jgi:hypothetical protein
MDEGTECNCPLWNIEVYYKYWRERKKKLNS